MKAPILTTAPRFQRSSLVITGQLNFETGCEQVFLFQSPRRYSMACTSLERSMSSDTLRTVRNRRLGITCIWVMVTREATTCSPFFPHHVAKPINRQLYCYEAKGAVAFQNTLPKDSQKRSSPYSDRYLSNFHARLDHTRRVGRSGLTMM